MVNYVRLVAMHQPTMTRSGSFREGVRYLGSMSGVFKDRGGCIITDHRVKKAVCVLLDCLSAVMP